MVYPIKVVDIELSRPIEGISGLEQYLGLQGLIRLHGIPIGYIYVPVSNGQVDAHTLSNEILEKHSKALINRLLQNGLLATKEPKKFQLEELFDLKPPEPTGELPLVTVAVCTRDRTEDLAVCLEALCQLDYPHLELIVVDNAPGTNATELLVKHHYPSVRYVLEPRPGLNWARNRAITEASGEIIAYTDDDVIVDTGWVKALAVLMVDNPEVMAVTGLVVPYELETEAQVLFEQYGGFGRGFQHKWIQANNQKVFWGHLGTGQFGTGANMAFRLSVFDNIGYFDPALDVGTVTNGGGDLELFFRVLKEGYMLVYEPNAMVRHRHRRDYQSLKKQLANNSRGLISYIVRSNQHYPDQKYSFFKLWLWLLFKWNLKRLIGNYFRAGSFPIELTLAELKGCFTSFGLYKKSRKNATIIAKQSGSEKDVEIDRPNSKQTHRSYNTNKKPGTAIRSINIKSVLQPLSDITEYAKVRIFVSWDQYSLGHIDIPNHYKPVSVKKLAEEIRKKLYRKILEPANNIKYEFRFANALSTLQKQFLTGHKTQVKKLSPEVIVSVVIATYDRPNDLRQCLKSIIRQASPRKIEIIVVDNNPSSGLTPPVVAEFKEVILVNESKKGLSYARNAGINACRGEIILSTDDDVVVPIDWVENLVTPFTRSDIMIVTGNVLPFELTTIPQHLFEVYGGLGRGFEKKEFNGKWFESFKKKAVPTWKLGACANAAFRASIFSHPKIGMIDETLGAGTPTGCSEDTYIFYKVLKLGYTLVYEPNAYVWHKHRTDLKALRSQIYNYSKGHVAYNLKTWLTDDDWRGLTRIFVELPQIHFKRFFGRLLGKSSYPISLILLEIRGNLSGPWALFQSSRRVKKLGKSTIAYHHANLQHKDSEHKYSIPSNIKATSVQVEK